MRIVRVARVVRIVKLIRILQVVEGNKSSKCGEGSKVCRGRKISQVPVQLSPSSNAPHKVHSYAAFPTPILESTLT